MPGSSQLFNVNYSYWEFPLPSCSWEDWRKQHLICKHFCAIHRSGSSCPSTIEIILSELPILISFIITVVLHVEEKGLRTQVAVNPVNIWDSYKGRTIFTFQKYLPISWAFAKSIRRFIIVKMRIVDVIYYYYVLCVSLFDAMRACAVLYKYVIPYSSCCLFIELMCPFDTLSTWWQRWKLFPMIWHIYFFFEFRKNCMFVWLFVNNYNLSTPGQTASWKDGTHWGKWSSCLSKWMCFD